MIVTATVRHAIEVWQRQPGRLLLPPLQGHTGSVEQLRITPDGTHLVSGSWDHTVRVWSLATGECQRVIRHGGWVLDLVMALSADGHTLFSIGLAVAGRNRIVVGTATGHVIAFSLHRTASDG